MSNIMVAGLVNIETTCPVKGFPLEYFPIDYPFNRIAAGISGVGYNLIRNLKTLGDEVDLVTMLGQDMWGEVIKEQLHREGFSLEHSPQLLDSTPMSVILYDGIGRREIYCDLKDYQDKSIDMSALEKAVEAADLVITCNSNFCRPLCRLAREKGKVIATDVHVFSDPDDEYNKDFLEVADIVFLSDEGVVTTPEELIRSIYERYKNRIIVMGCGSKGALLFEGEAREFIMVPAVTVGPIVSTSGAGDCLFSAFLHFYNKGETAKDSLIKATYAASIKIGASISSEGFASEEEILSVMDRHLS